MRLNSIKPAAGAKKNAKRVGRGIGSTDGKTCVPSWSDTRSAGNCMTGR